jgi:hypothetical protein
MGDQTKSHMLPEGVKDQKRREDILTLHLLRTIDRMTQPAMAAQPPPGLHRSQSRKSSMWEQGRNGRPG